MHKHLFKTALGEVWAWGAADALARDEPVVLVIEGAFAIERPRTFELQGRLPEAVVLNAHLPGNHCPALVTHSVGVYAAAYDEVLAQIGRAAVVVGASVGGLAGMAMRSPLLRGIVALDPPLMTGKLWPLVGPFRKRLANDPGDTRQREFIWAVFGISEDQHENRDYRRLVDQLTAPAWLLHGTEPLYPQRAIEELPSLLDDPEREAFAAHPGIRVRAVPGIGHNVGGRALDYVRTATRDLLAREIGAGQDLAAGR